MPAVLPLITAAGYEASILPTGDGIAAVAITHVQFGTGQYSVDPNVNPAAAQLTALVAPKEKRTIAGGYVTKTGEFRVDANFPEWTGVPNPYNAFEVGFFAGDPDAGGLLWAVYSHPTQPFALRGALPYLASFKCRLAQFLDDVIEIVVDPDMSVASNLVSLHEADPDPHPQYSAGFKVYAGNPNGFVAGSQGVPGGAFPTIVWDTTNEVWWVCKTTGNVATTVWSGVGAMAGWPHWCGTSTGTANAPVLATPAVMTSLTAGTALAWKIGVGPNTGAVVVTVGAFGNWPLYKDGPAGPAALTGGELDVGNICTVRFDGAVLHLVATELGTAALADATSNTGKVAAQSGAATVGNLPIYTDTQGTLGDSGTTPGALVTSAEAVMYRLGLLM